MRVLLDNNVDQRFGALLNGHEVTTARSLGWAELQNGELLRKADEAGFPVLVTADKNLRHQQTLKGLAITVLVLGSKFVDYQGISPLAATVLATLEHLPSGAFMVIDA